ncbi:pyruvate-formate lyase [Butyricicoccus faecihominis]|uniref:pyruvate formate lyase family protein n=1 Tax=Butyricicoccus faecihominis TaxID=1712515 RepID=UPI00247B1E44|nr:pyruvate formate lyase family protein [Butyricicoccus faecihominis]MCQ5128372.1 pyruvate-formate lyase [Butyricicoccus faecihominis]
MKRIEKIKQRMFDVEFQKKKTWWGEDESILTDDTVLSEPLVVRKALAIEYTMRNMPIEIKQDELVVGICTMSSVGMGQTFVDYATPEEKAEAAQSCYTIKSVWGHHPPNFDKLLRLGLRGIREEVTNRERKELNLDRPDTDKLNLFRAMLISLNAVSCLAQRYAQLALKEAQQADDRIRREELIEIADICGRVPENPAQTFHEALQSMWLTYMAFQSTLEWLPVARADQYLYPFFKHDREQGRLSAERAEELVTSWLAKFSEKVQVNSDDWEDHLKPEDLREGCDPEDVTAIFLRDNFEDYNYGSSSNHFLMNMIIGGQTPDGEDASNELTELILECWAYLEVISPVLSVRLHKNTPQTLLDRCAAILRCGSGEPALYNDDFFIPALVEAGVPLREARDYSNDGCWEVLIPGKSNFSYVFIEVLQMLEYALFRGRSLVRGHQEGIDTGDLKCFASFEEFYSAFLQQLANQVERTIRNKMKHHRRRWKIAPSPLLATMMDDCIEKGLDVSNGGARYDIFAVCMTGLSNCADSLAAIKMAVFDQHWLTLEQLAGALEHNFKGQESLRQALLMKIPKFGNDEAFCDDIAARLLGDFTAVTRQKANEIGNDGLMITFGIATYENYARFGRNIGASADGRLYREPIGSNYSPSLGMDMRGPTAAINSVTHANLLPYSTGAPLDLYLNANEVQGEEGIHRVTGLIRSFMELGGTILTITGVSEDLLRDAQEHPEKHRSMRVRMGGFSAYFVELSPNIQNTIIKRAKMDGLGNEVINQQ